MSHKRERPNKIVPQVFRIQPGLTREQAMKEAPKPKKDVRSFTYNPTTGKGSWL